MIDTLISQASGTRSSQGGAATNGLNLDSLLTGKGGLATGLAAGGLAGLLLGGKKPKKLAKNALKLGGVALVGGLAYKAWADWQNSKHAGAAPAPQRDRFFPENQDVRDQLSHKLARAMVAAANADGHIDAEERARMIEQLGRLDLDPSYRAFLAEELEQPASISEVVAEATSLELAAEIYTASVLVIDETNAAEEAYLSLLAARLGLDQALVDRIHQAARYEELEPA